MVVNLAEVISQVDGEMQEESRRRDSLPCERQRVLLRQLTLGERGKRPIHIADGPLDIVGELDARATALAEFGVAVTDEAALPEHTADEVPEVADEMLDQRPAGVCLARHSLPGSGVVRVALHLAQKRSEISQKNGAVVID